MQNAPNITQILQEWRNGKAEVLDELLPLVYDELHRQATRFLQKERNGHTLQATALIHEAYLKLIGKKEVEWQNRNHFFALAAMANCKMRIEPLTNMHTARKRIGNCKLLMVNRFLFLNDLFEHYFTFNQIIG